MLSSNSPHQIPSTQLKALGELGLQFNEDGLSTNSQAARLSFGSILLSNALSG